MTSSRPLYMGTIVNGGALRSSLIPSLALHVSPNAKADSIIHVMMILQFESDYNQ